MLKTGRVVIAVLFACGMAGAVRADDAAANGGPKPGTVLDQSNWQQAEGLLPPEILEHYKTGGYANQGVEWPLGTLKLPPHLQAPTEKNAGQFKISAEGTVVLNSTGEQPPYVLGYPFPIIDPADPQAAAKIVWNFFYLTWYFGSLHAESQVNWVSPTGLERRSDQDV